MNKKTALKNIKTITAYSVKFRFLITTVIFILFSSGIFADVIIDNEYGAPVFTTSGTWSASTSSGYGAGTYVYSAKAGNFAKWTPYISTAGEYEVIAVFRTGTNRGENAKYTIAYDGGTTTATLSQYSASSSVVQKSLGKFNFTAGNSGYVRLDAITEGKIYVADAIIFRSNTNDPPIVISLSHSPFKPLSTEKVFVTAMIIDDDTITTSTVRYSVSPTSPTLTAAAYNDGVHGDGAAGDSVYGAEIPPQTGGTTVNYYFSATDSGGNTANSESKSYLVYEGAFPEYRSIWAASWWSGFLNQTEADDFINTCRANNLNSIMPEVRKVGDAYYNSALEPRASNITGGASYDPLAYLIQSAHDTSGGKKKVGVHPWFVMHRIWRPDMGALPAGHILLTHPEYEMIKYDGSTDTESRWLDPGHPGTVEHNLAVILDCLSKYDIDGFHYDYIRYPGTVDWGYNAKSVERFNNIYGKTGLPSTTDPDWSNWRRECVTLELKKIYIKSWKMKPGIVVSAATFSAANTSPFETSGAYAGAFQDWADWLHQGIIDYNCIMNYRPESQLETFKSCVDRSLAEDDNRGSITGVGATDTETVQGTMDQLLYCRSKGADGMIIYSFRNEVLANTHGETRVNFYTELKNQVYPTWVEPPDMEWKKNPAAGIFEGNITYNGEPIDHAKVWIEGSPETETVTDGSGWYGIMNVPPGAKTINVTKAGYREGNVSSAIPNAGDIITVNITLEKDSKITSWKSF